ncbi:MAG: hypothetical protein ACRELC_04830, partial [Gemmatimonadota bacterium]
AIPVVSAGVLAAFALHEADDRRLRRFVILVGVVAASAIGYAAAVGAQIQHGDRVGARASLGAPDSPWSSPGAPESRRASAAPDSPRPSSLSSSEVRWS